MLEAIVRFSIARRWLVLGVTALAASAGAFAFAGLPIDAVPDITNVQVQVNAEAPGYSPLESEQRITFPIETALGGLPRLAYTRSVSRYGLSQVTVIFEDQDGKTKMTLIHTDLPAGKMSEETGAGWNESFDKLAGSLSRRTTNRRDGQ